MPTIKYNHGFEAFLVWLSENEITEEQKAEIVESFDFEDFTLEELSVHVLNSGLYAVDKVVKRMTDIRFEKELQKQAYRTTELQDELKSLQSKMAKLTNFIQHLK